MNATQPSVAFTTITGKASLLVPSPFRSAPGTLPSGRLARKSFTPALCKGMGPTSSARAGGRMGSRVATPVEAGGGAGATGDGAGVDETGVGDVVGVGVEPPQPAMSPRSNTGMCRGVMVDSTARRLRGVGR